MIIDLGRRSTQVCLYDRLLAYFECLHGLLPVCLDIVDQVLSIYAADTSTALKFKFLFSSEVDTFGAISMAREWLI